MRIHALGFVLFALAGCAAPRSTATPHQIDVAAEECRTTRDVQVIVLKLRGEGWSAARTIESILGVAQVDDEETRAWFVALVHRMYDEQATPEGVEDEYNRCLRGEPAPAASVLAA